MSHKQDRHNCSIHINMKIFLADLTKWRVHITGSHIPPESPVLWVPPPPDKQRLDEDLRDLMISCSNLGDPTEVSHTLKNKLQGGKVSVEGGCYPPRNRFQALSWAWRRGGRRKATTCLGRTSTKWQLTQRRLLRLRGVAAKETAHTVKEITVQLIG